MKLLSLIAAGVTAFIQASPEPVRLLRTGTFLIAPPRVPATEQWFGLQRTGDKWALIKVKPSIEPAKPICGDQAAEISVVNGSDVPILLTGLKRLSEGPVTSVVNNPRVLYPGERLEIGFGFSLEALGTAIRETGGNVLVNYSLWIRHRQTFQQIASFKRSAFDNPRQLVWAGDLDRDERPDLLFDFPPGDVGANYVLFLSSLRGNQLLAKAASFSTPGC